MPAEAETGDHWRGIYNKYLTKDVTPEIYVTLLKDFYISVDDWDEEREDALLNWELPLIRLADYVVGQYGRDIYDALLALNSTISWHNELDADDIEDCRLFFCEGEYRNKPHFDWEGLDPTHPLPVCLWGRTRWVPDEGEECIANPFLIAALSECKIIQGSKSVRKLLTAIGVDDIPNTDSDSFWLQISPDGLFNSLYELIDLRILKRIVGKTWLTDGEPEPWTANEFDFLNRFVCDSYFCLTNNNNADRLIHPHLVEIESGQLVYSKEGQDGIYSLVANFIIDFIGELIHFNRHHSEKGTALCIDCGQAYPRRFYGQGQKYCSIQCKERAKKRRQRGKKNRERFMKQRDR